MEQGDAYRHEPLSVTSLHDLETHEKEILRRLHAVPNGGLLFLTHPFRLLADVGVTLPASVRDELTARVPELRALSSVSYDALRKRSDPLPVRVELKSLFPKASPSRG